MDAATFSTYFWGCPVLDVPGRTFPVKEHYQGDDRFDEVLRGVEALPKQAVAAAEGQVGRIHDKLKEVARLAMGLDQEAEPGENILIFLSGEV